MDIKQIKGYENLYEITEDGKVFAMERIVISGKRLHGFVGFVRLRNRNRIY